jgi:hypothetical protein
VPATIESTFCVEDLDLAVCSPSLSGVLFWHRDGVPVYDAVSAQNGGGGGGGAPATHALRLLAQTADGEEYDTNGSSVLPQPYEMKYSEFSVAFTNRVTFFNGTNTDIDVELVPIAQSQLQQNQPRPSGVEFDSTTLPDVELGFTVNSTTGILSHPICKDTLPCIFGLTAPSAPSGSATAKTPLSFTEVSFLFPGANGTVSAVSGLVHMPDAHSGINLFVTNRLSYLYTTPPNPSMVDGVPSPRVDIRLAANDGSLAYSARDLHASLALVFASSATELVVNATTIASHNDALEIPSMISNDAAASGGTFEVSAGDVSGSTLVAPVSLLISTAFVGQDARTTVMLRPDAVTTAGLLEPLVLTMAQISFSVPSLIFPGFADTTSASFQIVQCPQVLAAQPFRTGDNLVFSQYYPEVVISRVTYIDVSNTTETGDTIVHFFPVPLTQPTEESTVDGDKLLVCTLLSDGSTIITPIRVTACVIGCASQGLAEIALVVYSKIDGSANVLDIVRSVAFVAPNALAVASPAAMFNHSELTSIIPCNTLDLTECFLSSNVTLPLESCSANTSVFSELPYTPTTLPCFAVALASSSNETQYEMVLAQLSSTESLTLLSVALSTSIMVPLLQDSSTLSIQRVPTSYPNKMFLQSEHEFLVCGVTFDLEGARSVAQMSLGDTSAVVASVDLVLEFAAVGSDSHEMARNVTYPLAPVVVTVALPPDESSQPDVVFSQLSSLPSSCCNVASGSCAACFYGDAATSTLQLQQDNTTPSVFLFNATYFGTAERLCTVSQVDASTVSVNVSDCLSLVPLSDSSHEVLSALSGHTTLEIFAVTAADGHHVIVNTPNLTVSANFSEQIALTLFPVIDSVSGCEVNAYPGTGMCSLSGGGVLTISGRDFAGLFPWEYYAQVINETVEVNDALGSALLANDKLTVSIDFVEVIGSIIVFATVDCAVLTASFEMNTTERADDGSLGMTTVVDTITCMLGSGFGTLGSVTITSAIPGPVKHSSITSAAGLVSFAPAVYCPIGDNLLMCSGHGLCDFSTGLCDCNVNTTNSSASGVWVGALCDTCDEYYNQSIGCTMACPVGENELPCSGLGLCASGACTCEHGYAGPACDITCPAINGSVCSGQGVCNAVDGTCSCFNSSSQGHFMGAACGACQSPWTGANCNKTCLVDPINNLTCGGRGTCYEGACYCAANERCGPLCEILLTSPNASRACDLCAVDSLFGDTCTEECPGTLAPGLPCSGHGECSNGMEGIGLCLCDFGFGGADCSALCPRDIEGNVCGGIANGGTCHPQTAQCLCNGTNTGVACDIPCPMHNGLVCGGTGTCVSDGYQAGCKCFPYYGGVSCNETCTGHRTQCSGHGICMRTGFCSCTETNATGYWAGDGNCSTCSQEYNGANCLQQCARGSNGLQCSGHGICVGTTCSCFSGRNQSGEGAWSGAVCDQCFPGFFGENCTGECPGGWCSPCGLQGVCSQGVNGTGLCTCNTSDTLGSFGGASCSACAAGFYGSNCTSMCPKSASPANASLMVVCGGRGTCSDGFNGTGVCSCSVGFSRLNSTSPCDRCASGYYGSRCLRCISTTATPCSGRGLCSDGLNGTGACTCNVGFGGPSCAFTCAVASNMTCGRGVCVANNTCNCSTNFARVTNGTCASCVSGFWGVNCSQACPACANGATCSRTQGTCTCAPGYWGPLCLTQCPGGAANPCSGHGVCSVASGTCTCFNSSTQGYYQGATCDVCQSLYASTTCRLACPINSISGTVCNSRGKCFNGLCSNCYPLSSEYSSTVAICGVGCELRDAACFTFLNNCTQGFWGTGCPFTCPGTTSDGAVVCSSNGICDADSGVCICKGGYYGDDCASSCARSMVNNTNLTTTSSSSGNNSYLPCSGQGSCAGNTCNCFTGFFGEACEYECPGGAQNPCNGRGECSVFGVCTCDGSAYGTSCDLPCPGGFELPCNFQGTCMSSGGCSCFNDAINGFYAGGACESCYGTYYGEHCNITCSPANGFVVGRDCVCAAGFLGDGCTVACPTTAENGVCNGHGTCSLSENETTAECSCDENYYGSICDVFCSVAYCTSDGVGLQRAQCNPINGLCECQQSPLGNFSGTTCNDCAAEWSGIECNIPCECSGNGQCDRYLGTCTCNFADDTGYWTGSNCSTCAPGYMGGDCKTKNVEISQAGTAGEAIVNSGFPATGVSLQDSDFGVIYVGANPIVLINVTGPNSSAVSIGVLHLLPAESVVAVSAAIANSTHVLLWCTIGEEYVRIHVPRDPVSFLALGSVDVMAASTTSRRGFASLATLTPSPALSATSALTGCTVTATSGQPTANVLCNDGTTLQIALLSTFEIASLSFVLNGSVLIVAGTRVTSGGGSGSNSGVGLSTSGWFREAYDAMSNWAVLFTSDYTTSPFAECQEDPVTLNALCPYALGCVTFPDFTAEQMVCAWRQVLVDSASGAVTSRSILFARVFIANGSFVEAAVNDTTPQNTPRIISGGLEMTAVTGDLDFGIVIAAVLDSTNTTTLYKIDHATLAITGTYQVPQTLGDPALVSSLAVDQALRILYMSTSTALSVNIMSLNLFGVKFVVPTTADLLGGRVVTVHGEGFRPTETYLCIFGSVPSEQNATFIDNSTLLCVAPPASEDNQTADVCVGLNVNVQVGGVRSTNVSYVPIYRPLSAVLNYAFTAAGPGIGDSHVPTAITVSGFGFVRSDAPSCKFLDSSGPNGTLRLIFETTNVSYLSTSEIVCNQPNLTSEGPSVPPAVIYYSHDSTVYSTTAATYAAVGVFDHLRAQDATGSSLSATDSTEIQVTAQMRTLIPAVTMFAADTFGNLMGSLDITTRPMKCSAANPISGASEISYWANDTVLAVTMSAGVARFNNMILSSPSAGLLSFYCYDTRDLINFVTFPVRISVGDAAKLLMTIPTTWVVGVLEATTLTPNPIVSVADIAGNVISTSVGLPPQARLSYRTRQPDGMNDGEILVNDNTIIASVSDDGTYEFTGVSVRTVFGTALQLTVFASQSITTLVSSPLQQQRCISGTEYAATGGFSCEPCPQYGICDGTSIVVTEPGNWRANFQAYTFYPCEPAAACPQSTQCANGYEGPLCGSCASGYGLSGSECMLCDSSSVNATFIVLLFFVGSILIYFLSIFSMPFSTYEDNLIGIGGSEEQHKALLPIFVKLIISHFQIASVVPVKDLSLPAWIASFFTTSKDFSSFNPNLSFLSCEVAHNAEDRMVTTVVSVPLLIACLALVAIGVAWWQNRTFVARQLKGSKNARRKQLEALSNPTSSHVRDMKYIKATFDAEDRIEVLKHHTDLLGWTDDAEAVWRANNPAASGFFAPPTAEPLQAAESVSGEAEVSNNGEIDLGNSDLEKSNTLSAHIETSFREVVGTTVPAPPLWHRWLNMVLLAANVTLFFMYPSIVENCVNALKCSTLDAGPNLPPLSVLTADPAIDCNSDAYQNTTLRIAILFIVLFGIGTPLLSALLIIAVQHITCRGDVTIAKRMFSFMTKGYRLWFWEGISLARKAMIVVLVTLVPSSEVRTLSAVWVMTVFLAVSALVSPWADSSLAVFENVSFATLIASYSLLTLLYLDEVSSNEGAKIAILTFVVLVNILCLLYFIKGLIDAMRGFLFTVGKSNPRIMQLYNVLFDKSIDSRATYNRKIREDLQFRRQWLLQRNPHAVFTARTELLVEIDAERLSEGGSAKASTIKAPISGARFVIRNPEAVDDQYAAIFGEENRAASWEYSGGLDLVLEAEASRWLRPQGLSRVFEALMSEDDAQWIAVVMAEIRRSKRLDINNKNNNDDGNDSQPDEDDDGANRLNASAPNPLFAPSQPRSETSRHSMTSNSRRLGSTGALGGQSMGRRLRGASVSFIQPKISNNEAVAAASINEQHAAKNEDLVIVKKSEEDECEFLQGVNAQFGGAIAHETSAVDVFFQDSDDDDQPQPPPPPPVQSAREPATTAATTVPPPPASHASAAVDSDMIEMISDNTTRLMAADDQHQHELESSGNSSSGRRKSSVARKDSMVNSFMKETTSPPSADGLGISVSAVHDSSEWGSTRRLKLRVLLTKLANFRALSLLVPVQVRAMNDLLNEASHPLTVLKRAIRKYTPIKVRVTPVPPVIVEKMSYAFESLATAERELFEAWCDVLQPDPAEAALQLTKSQSMRRRSKRNSIKDGQPKKAKHAAVAIRTAIAFGNAKSQQPQEN